MPALISFGREITRARKAKEISQKQLAERVQRDEGAISPQYLNDIEHDRRVPSSVVIRALAAELGLDSDYLHYLAKKWPEDIAEAALGPEQVRELMFALRQRQPNSL